MGDKLNDGNGKFSLEDIDTGKNWYINVSPGRLDSLEEAGDVSTEYSAGSIKFFVDRDKKKHAVGFYSAHKLAHIDAPDYAKTLFFFVDEFVFGNTTDKPSICLKKRFGVREFEVGLEGRVLKRFLYDWPWYRELWLDPMSSSKDLIANLVQVSKSYHPEWLAPLS